MYDDVITLVSTTQTVNGCGDKTETETERSVFAQVRSVNSKRKTEALAVGLRLEYEFVLADAYEYNDEEKVRYNGKDWNVFDTYRTPDNRLELKVKRY